MNNPDPVPRDFGWRYIAWMAWCNAITILAVLQGALASVLLAVDDSAKNPLLTHNEFRLVILGNAVLTGLIAQVKRNKPPGPPPVKQV
jgi:hypothetical protein